MIAASALELIDREALARAYMPPDRCAGAPDGVVLIRGTEIEPESVKWLWEGWLAAGKLHMLAGAPGEGKTTIAMSLAARCTTGELWPDGAPCETGNVLVWSGEDSYADTLLPRIIAAGGDRERVYFVSGTRVRGEVRPFDPSRDVHQLAELAIQVGNVRLIVVDPVVGAVRGNGHENSEVRRSLQPLVELAESTGAAIIGITHFNKSNGGGDPAQRVIGSVAFTALARVVLVAGKRSEDSSTRVLAVAKSNLGSDRNGIEYRMEQGRFGHGQTTAIVKWGDPVEGSASDLLAAPDETPERPTRRQTAEALLINALTDGPQLASEVQALSRQAGIAAHSLTAAANRLGVERNKSKEVNGPWYWSLPPKSSKASNNLIVTDPLASDSSPSSDGGGV